MTTITLPRAPGRSRRLRPMFAFFWTILDGIREGREIAHRYDTLSRLSDAELAKLGLDRTEVPQAAVTGFKAA